MASLTAVNWQSYAAQVQTQQTSSVNYGLPVQRILPTIHNPTHGSDWFFRRYGPAMVYRAGTPLLHQRQRQRQTGIGHQSEVLGHGASSREKEIIERVQDERQTGVKMEPAKVHNRSIANTIDGSLPRDDPSTASRSSASGTKHHLENERAADRARAKFRFFLELQKSGAWVIAPAA
ncbi:hypothetical protein ACFQUU_28035 [Herbaspirillum sp. GCM10030257]|uniref:hypothetical protein n=1 Tax=Herbaspirillum sp. GCM10030257 TaxID=3273393 RepID=UPI00360CB692